jgi:hypothetical protein
MLLYPSPTEWVCLLYSGLVVFAFAGACPGGSKGLPPGSHVFG